MSSDSSQKLRWLYGVCIVLSLLIAAGLIREIFFPKKLELINLQLLPVSKPLESIELKTADGPIDLQNIPDTWVVIFMGFTFCPDVCPVELQKLGQMLVKFKEANETPPLVAFVSVDPERDSIEKMAEYVTYFHPEIYGVTGDNRSLKLLANFFGVTYSRSVKIGEKEYLVEAGADMPTGSGEHYVVNHSSRIFVINPKGEYVGSFSPPYTTDVLFEDMQELMNH